MKKVQQWKKFYRENCWIVKTFLPWKFWTVQFNPYLYWKLSTLKRFQPCKILYRDNQSLSILEIEYREKIYRERCSTVKNSSKFWAVKIRENILTVRNINREKSMTMKNLQPWKILYREKIQSWKRFYRENVHLWKIFDRENQSLIMVHIRYFEPWKIHHRENDQR